MKGTYTLSNLRVSVGDSEVPITKNYDYTSEIYSSNGICELLNNGNTKVYSEAISGCPGAAYLFNGSSSERLNCGYFSFLKTAVTFNCWIKPTKLGNTGFIMSQGRDYDKYGFNLAINNNKIAVYAGTTTSNVWLTADNDLVEIGKWYMITGTYDGENVKLYINGKLCGTAALSGELDYTQAWSAFVIGKMSYGYNNSDNYFPFNGYIADPSVYATALSQDNIKHLYHSAASFNKMNGIKSKLLIENNSYDLLSLINKDSIITNGWDRTVELNGTELQFTAGNGWAMFFLPVSSLGLTGRSARFSFTYRVIERTETNVFVVVGTGTTAYNIDGTRLSINIGEIHHYSVEMTLGNNIYFMVRGTDNSGLITKIGISDMQIILSTETQKVQISQNKIISCRNISESEIPYNKVHLGNKSDGITLPGTLRIGRSQFRNTIVRDGMFAEKINREYIGNCVNLNSDNSSPLGIPSTTTLTSAEQTALGSLYDNKVYTEPDGTKWIRVFHHNNPVGGLFTATSTGFKTGQVYESADRWYCMGKAIEKVSDSWEIMIKQKETTSSTEMKYRWVQRYNPLTTLWTDVTEKSLGLTKHNKSSGYSTWIFDDKSEGLIKYSNGETQTFLAYNDLHGSWFCAIGCSSLWNGGIPGMSIKAITTGYLDAYLRISPSSIGSNSTCATTKQAKEYIDTIISKNL